MSTVKTAEVTKVTDVPAAAVSAGTTTTTDTATTTTVPVHAEPWQRDLSHTMNTELEALAAESTALTAEQAELETDEALYLLMYGRSGDPFTLLDWGIEIATARDKTAARQAAITARQNDIWQHLIELVSTGGAAS